MECELAFNAQSKEEVGMEKEKEEEMRGTRSRRSGWKRRRVS